MSNSTPTPRVAYTDGYSRVVLVPRGGAPYLLLEDRTTDAMGETAWRPTPLEAADRRVALMARTVQSLMNRVDAADADRARLQARLAEVLPGDPNPEGLECVECQETGTVKLDGELRCDYHAAQWRGDADQTEAPL